MLYNIVINQYGIVSKKMEKSSDLIDWAIICYLQSWYFAEKSKKIFNQDNGINYIWINYNHLIESMPLLGIKDKSGISYRIKKLKKLGLIDTFQTKENSLYFCLTEKCMNVISFSNLEEKSKKSKKENPENTEPVEIEQTGGVDEIQQGVQIDTTGVFKLTQQHNNIINNNNISNNISLLKKEESLEDSFLKESNIVAPENLISENQLYSVKEKKVNDVYKVFLIYSKYWEMRYKKKPVLTQKMAGNIKNILKAIKDFNIIEKMIEAFIKCNDGFLCSKFHDIAYLLQDLNKYYALADNPDSAQKMGTEYIKARMNLQAWQQAKKDEEEKRKKEFIENYRKQEEELKRLREEEQRKKEEIERLKKEEAEKIKAEREKFSKIIKETKEKLERGME